MNKEDAIDIVDIDCGDASVIFEVISQLKAKGFRVNYCGIDNNQAFLDQVSMRLKSLVDNSKCISQTALIVIIKVLLEKM